MLHIIRPKNIESVVGLKQTRIRELEARDEFPKRVRLSERAVGWRSDEVQAWLESRPRAEDVPSDTTERNGIGTIHTGASKKRREASVSTVTKSAADAFVRIARQSGSTGNAA